MSHRILFPPILKQCKRRRAFNKLKIEFNHTCGNNITYRNRTFVILYVKLLITQQRSPWHWHHIHHIRTLNVSQGNMGVKENIFVAIKLASLIDIGHPNRNRLRGYIKKTVKCLRIFTKLINYLRSRPSNYLGTMAIIVMV